MKKERFKADLIWDGRSGGRVRTGEHHRIRLDMPRRFGGMGRYACPDELFLAGIAGCLLTTFLHFKRKIGVNVRNVKISASATLSVHPQGYRISKVKATMHAKTTNEDKVDARRCIKLAIEYCHITRSLERAIPIQVTGRVAAAR